LALAIVVVIVLVGYGAFLLSESGARLHADYGLWLFRSKWGRFLYPGPWWTEQSVERFTVWSCRASGAVTIILGLAVLAWGTLG